MKYHYTLIRMVKSKTPATPNAGQDVEQQEISFIAALEDSLAVSYTAKHNLTIQPINSSVVFLVIYTDELKTCVHIETCT